MLSSPGTTERLTPLCQSIYRAAESRSPCEGLEQALIDECIEILTASCRFETGRTKAFSIVDAALQTLHDRDRINFRVNDLCDISGLSERTLLRSFHRIIGMGPKHYLLLRQLNLIRRALYEGANDERRVTDVLTDCGISELGRVSGQYKKLFGELPSQTLRNLGLFGSSPARVRVDGEM